VQREFLFSHTIDMKYIDTHTHLFSKQFNNDRHEAVHRAIDAGVEKMLLPNIDVESIEEMYALCDSFKDNCLPMIGLHPSDVKADYETALAEIEAQFGKRDFIAIGETGLDYYWDTTFKEQQKKSLLLHIRWAKEKRLPIVLHTRNSFEDTLEMIKAEKDQNLTGIFHCFSGTKEDADKIMNVGFSMGIGGVLTFKNSGIAEVVAGIPIEYLVLETDSPYLAPVPYRGKRNESSYIPIIAQKLAEVKNMSIEEVAKITTENAKRLFNL